MEASSEAVRSNKVGLQDRASPGNPKPKEMADQRITLLFRKAPITWLAAFVLDLSSRAAY